MSKSTHFLGQPSYLQLIKLLDKSEIDSIIRNNDYNRYTKKFDAYTHLITYLYAVLCRYDSIRELVVGLLSNAHKLHHLSINYCVKRSTFAFANNNRSSDYFAKVYSMLYSKYAPFLLDSHTKGSKKRRLYIMDSTTITLFSNILKGAGRNPIKGKKKGGIKVHTIITSDENVPRFIKFTSAATHDHTLLKDIHLPIGSIIVFDKAYVDYGVYERFSKEGITYVTKLKDNARFEGLEEINIPDNADDGIIKDENIVLSKKGTKEREELNHNSRRIAYWDDKKGKLIVFLTNSTELSAEDVIDIYKRRWQIESLFKQLKQNFQLRYFYGDSVNAIESQIWMVMIANLLLTVLQKGLKRPWAFSNLATIVRLILMNYYDLYSFLENPENDWINLVENEDKLIKIPTLFD